MSILKVAKMGNPVLRTKARAIDPLAISSPAFQKLIDDMFETMAEYDGVGLAAPQVHEGLRLFTASLGMESRGDARELMAFINPEVQLVGSAREDDWEGCLSIPDIRGLVPRAREVRVRAYARSGERFELKATGFSARVIQHEFDHLEGILFFDRMKSLESLTFLQEYSRYWVNDEDEGD